MKIISNTYKLIQLQKKTKQIDEIKNRLDNETEWIDNSKVMSGAISEEKLSEELADKINRTKRSIEYLWKKAKGSVYDTEIIDTVSYSNKVPSGAMEYAEMQMIGGKTVNYNQYIIPFSESWGSSNINCTYSLTNGKGRLIWNGENDYVGKRVEHNFIAGHKYVLYINATSSITDSNMKVDLKGATQQNVAYNESLCITSLFTSNYNNTYFQMDFSGDLTEGDYINLTSLYLTDLTKMFGAGNEPGTIGEVKTIFPEEDYQVYTSSVTINAPVDKIINYDKNLFDVSEKPIPLGIREINGYGYGLNDTVYNYVDFVSKKFHRKCDYIEGVLSELPQEQIVDLSDILTDQDFDLLQVEANGTVEYHSTNEYGINIPVPNKTEYMIEVDAISPDPDIPPVIIE